MLILSAIALFIFTINKEVSSGQIETVHELYVSCYEKHELFRDKGVCYRELAGELYGEYQLNIIELGVNSVKDNKKRQWCHEFMHYIGWEAYNDLQNTADAFVAASGLCDSGMYHGIMEESINQKMLSGEEISIEGIVKTACDEAFSSRKNISSGIYTLCYHGLGHGLMFITQNELLDSFEYCDLLDNGFNVSCYTGVLMENNQSKQVGALADHTSKYAPDENNLDYPCNILNEKHKTYCYEYLGANLLTKTNGNSGEAFALCKELDEHYKKVCFRGVGSNIPGPHIDEEGVANSCLEAFDVGEDAYEECIKGAVQFLTYLQLGVPEKLVLFCSLVEEAFRSTCYIEVGNTLSIWTTDLDPLESKCSVFKSETAQRLCVGTRD